MISDFDSAGSLPGAPALYPRFLMTHPEMGVYLGSCIGLGFWSKLDPAGQEEAVTFDRPEDGKLFAASWTPDDEEFRIEPETLVFVPVTCAHPHYATMAEMAAAGVETWNPDEP